MGCRHSKRSSAVHPVNSKNSSHSDRNKIPSPEPLEAPPSTPEPNEEEITLALVLPQQTHTSCDRKQLQGRQESQRDGIWQQPSITDDRNSRETFSTSSNNSPAVVGSTAAGGGEDETTCMDGCRLQCAPEALGQDQGEILPTGNRVPQLSGHSPLHRPPYSRFRSGVPANSPLQIYGTDSQIEFFKMLDKKIDGGPDYSDGEESG